MSIIIVCATDDVSASGSQRIVVAQDGGGDYRTINEAIAAAPADASETVVIFIRSGEYREKVFVDRPHITLLGESRQGTRIVYPILWRKWEEEYRAKGDMLTDIRWGCATINIGAAANDCSLLNLTVYNNYGTTVEKLRDHQFAVFGRSTRTIILGCDVLSDGSDDLSLWNKEEGMYYHADCYFRCPGVDYVCPRGWCYVENCKFEGSASAHIWHDGDYNRDQKFVLRNCTFDADLPATLGRYHRESQFYLLDCHFSEMIARRIGYAYQDRQPDLRWGERVYYWHCTRDGGNYDWMADNLSQAPGNPDPEEITPLWTFDGKWDPMPKVAQLRKLYE